MATVRMTDTLRAEVRSKFVALREHQMQKSMNKLQNLEIAEECYDFRIPKSQQELAIKMSSYASFCWISKQDYLPISMDYTSKLGFDVRVQFTISNTKNFLLPLDLLRKALHLDPSLPSYPKAVAVFYEIDATKLEYGSMIEELVDGAMRECANLKQLLNVWPSALEYMPDYVQHRHNEQEKRAKRRTGKDVKISDDIKISLIKTRMGA